RKYPDPMAAEPRRGVADRVGAEPENVLCGNGSDDLLNMAVRAFCAEGQAIAYPRPSYSLYSVLGRIQGAHVETVEFPEDYALPREKLVDVGARLVMVPNPNSPSGTMVPPEEMSRLADELDGVLLIDEAYVDFADADCMELALRHDNVIVTRSLSKSYSLAGLRFGYAVAPKRLIEGLAKVKDSYNVGRLAAAGAAAALRDDEWMKKNARKVRHTRQRLVDGLQEMDFHCWPSSTNFVLARPPEGWDAGELHTELFERKILVRYFDTPRLQDSLRITVGTDDEIDALLDELRDIGVTA
ncbi:MAG: histidinol-phosphate transaminase, partial [Planctomycetota bacterium]